MIGLTIFSSVASKFENIKYRMLKLNFFHKSLSWIFKSFSDATATTDATFKSFSRNA